MGGAGLTQTQGWLPKREKEAWEKGTEAQEDEETRDTGRTPIAATSPSCIPPAPTSTYSGPGLGSSWQTHPPSLAQMSNGLRTEGKAVLRPQ